MNQNYKFNSSNNMWIDKFSFIENYQVLSYDTTLVVAITQQSVS